MRELRKAVFAVAAALVFAVTGTVSGAAAAPPVSTSNLSCDKLASATAPTKAFSAVVTKTNPAITETLGAGQLLPGTDVIRAAGGLVCEWSNGRPYGYAPDTGYVGVRVEFLHGAADGYWRWASVLGPVTTPESWFCGSGHCQFMSSRGGDWLFVAFDGARSDAAALALAQSIRTAIQLGSESVWAPVPSAHPLGIKCEQIVPIEALKAAVGTTIPLAYRLPLPGWSLWHVALDKVPAPMCGAYTASGSASGGTFRTLPSGEWGFDELRSSLTLPGPLVPFRAVPLPAGDRAYIRCNVVGTQCILDAILAGHWIQVELPPDGRTRIITASRTTALADILRAAIVEVYS